MKKRSIGLHSLTDVSEIIYFGNDRFKINAFRKQIQIISLGDNAKNNMLISLRVIILLTIINRNYVTVKLHG